MNKLYPIQEWARFRTGVGSENGDRQLTTTNKNWEQRNGNLLRTTSGSLKIGTKYTLQNWITDDDLSNVGAINEDGWTFTATGTTPTKWTNSSVMEEWGTERGRLIPVNAETVFLAFMGAHASDPNNGIASIKIYLYRRRGPAMLVGEYDLTVGDQDVIRYPYPPYETVLKKNYVDKIVRVESDWIQEPQIVGGDTDDGIAMLRIPTFGAEFILVEVDSVGSGIALDVLMSSSAQLAESVPTEEIKRVEFPTITWVTSEGHAPKTAVVRNVNMLVERIVLIISSVTGGPATTFTFADDTGAVIIDPTNFAALADGTVYQKLSTKATADFDAVPINGDITITMDPDADAGGSGQTLSITPIFYGP